MQSKYSLLKGPFALAKETKRRTCLILFVISLLLVIVYMIDLKLETDRPVVIRQFKVIKLNSTVKLDTKDFSSDGLEYTNYTLEDERVKKLFRTPIILYWNRYFSDEYEHFVPKESSKINCPYNCIHTANHRFGAQADIRIFHERNFDPENLPPNNPDALNVYYTLEPPYLTFSKFNRKTSAPLNYFNYTASYRSRSMIYYPYDTFVEIDGSEDPKDVWTNEEVEQKIALKQKAALIAISNCGAESLRREYVRELRKYINITQVGSCDGNVQCEKDPDGKALRIDMDCMKRLNEEHHFYLAFENAVCPEYTTEKFWRMKQLIVPVVLSRSAMPKHIPNDTYIAASDFESPEHLANFLNQLMQNKNEYRKYFNWTKKYRRTRITEEEIAVSCQLCKLAHKQPRHRIRDYKTYWHKRECIQDYGKFLLNNSPENLNSVRCAEQRLASLMNSTYRYRKLGKIV